MKKKAIKFITSLIIILLFSGFVFYVGWTQYKVDIDNFGIVISKTSGINKNIITAGNFSWNWEFLLPTNAKLQQFQKSPYIINRTTKDSLPNYKLYTEKLNQQVDFSYQINYQFNITVTEESAMSLIKNSIIKDKESLTEYINSYVDKAIQYITTYCLSNAKNNFLYNPETLEKDELIDISKAKERFPELQINSISITSTKLPDYQLYNKLRDKYLEEINTQQIKEL